MCRSVLIVILVMLVTLRAGGQQPNPPQPPPHPQLQPPPAPEPVKVYDLRSPVIAPRLLPFALIPPSALAKNCKDNWDAEVELSLLVDTAGMPRNILFLRPSGSGLDQIALELAREDRFQPGTVDGKPVVVAVSLRLKLKTCVGPWKDEAGKITTSRQFRSIPGQKIVKPQNPPQEAVLAPLKTSAHAVIRKVSRPDYFGNGRSAPVIIYSADAPYTPSKTGAKISGICTVSLVVDANGMPGNVRVLKSLDPGLDRSALDAVNMYRFFPAIEDEHPVSAAIVIDINFTPPPVALNNPEFE